MLTEIVEALDLSTSPSGDSFGPVSESCVKLRGPLCQAVFSRTTRPFNRRNSGLHQNRAVTIGGTTFRQNEAFHFALNDPSEQAVEQILGQVVYIMLGTTTPFGYEPGSKEFDAGSYMHTSGVTVLKDTSDMYVRMLSTS